MSNLMQETVDWSLYPFRLMARTMDLMSRTTADVGSAVTECVRPESTRWESSSTSGRFRSTGDIDLGGDDIKVVQSYIASTKPDHEQVYEVHTEVVNYSTTHDAYAGVVVGRFLRQHPEFPEEDFRYLKPHIKVVERYPKEEEDDWCEEHHVHHHHKRHETSAYRDTRSEVLLT